MNARFFQCAAQVYYKHALKGLQNVLSSLCLVNTEVPVLSRLDPVMCSKSYWVRLVVWSAIAILQTVVWSSLVPVALGRRVLVQGHGPNLFFFLFCLLDLHRRRRSADGAA